MTPAWAGGRCGAAMELVDIYLRVERADIALIKCVIESYEEFGIVRTIDNKQAIIVLLVVPDFTEHVWAALESLRQHMDWHQVPRPTDSDDWLMEKMHPGTTDAA